ncbi:PilZ domain-containing protein [Devosia sp. Root635]|uniref:PilZ domain-containing protein n=1 Tax=Devosia sp. Root635 TaxID=1736575 RepID=UPI0006FDAD29|nr:PilZ domain-containing protein [Devosia sp. Root635]KRA42568.1 hypothetical protein ASD80_08965 [Devosia sp. Root635]
MSATEIDHSLHNISTVAGRYVLGQQARRPGVNIFACRLRTISPTGFVVSAPVIGAIGEQVSASFAPFGNLHGRIGRHVADGFAVELDGAEPDLADRIETFRHKPWHGLADKRAEKRFMPAEPRSVIILEGGDVLPCLIVDYSASGAAISADTTPIPGAPVTIGHVPGRVVRLFDVGFAVHFDARQPPDEIEGLLEAPLEWRRAVTVLQPRHIDTSEPGDTAEGYGYD